MAEQKNAYAALGVRVVIHPVSALLAAAGPRPGLRRLAAHGDAGAVDRLGWADLDCLPSSQASSPSSSGTPQQSSDPRRPPSALVAGAGPVGLTAALTLAGAGARGHRPRGRSLPGRESRASTSAGRAWRCSPTSAASSRSMERGLASTGFQYRDRRTGPIADLDLGVLDRGHPVPVPAAPASSRKLTPIVLEAPPGDRRHGAASTSAVQASTDGDTGDRTTATGDTFTADWVLGADGANSQVLQTPSAFTFEGMTYPERFLGRLDRPRTWRPSCRDLGGDLRLLPDRVAGRCCACRSTGGSSSRPTRRPPTRSRTTGPGSRSGCAAWPTSAATGTSLHTTLYRVHQRVADTFRKGRLLLMGDAAHINNPLGGMGMNSGLHDAVRRDQGAARPDPGRGTEEQLDEACEARRQVALSYVKTITHDNWESFARTTPRRSRPTTTSCARWPRDRERMRKHLQHLDDRTPCASARSSTAGSPGLLMSQTTFERENPARDDELVGSVGHRPGRRRHRRGPAPDRAAGLGAIDLGARCAAVRAGADRIAAEIDDARRADGPRDRQAAGRLPRRVGLRRDRAAVVADRAHGSLADRGDRRRGRAGCSSAHRPFGVVAAVTPWNAPVILALLKVAPRARRRQRRRRQAVAARAARRHGVRRAARVQGPPDGCRPGRAGRRRDRPPRWSATPVVDKVAFTGGERRRPGDRRARRPEPHPDA